MGKRNKRTDPYSKEAILRERTFPMGSVIWITALLLVQILAMTLALLYTPTPQDRIDLYEITVTPREDGSLDLDYHFVWTPLDKSEDLTWIEIGMANPSFTFYEDSFSPTIVSHEKYVDEDYVSARLYLDRPYIAGETLEFSFSVCQRDMLCREDHGYFYEFVPGWFNATPVENYRFIWKASPMHLSANTSSSISGEPAWEGSMPCGTYITLEVHYGADTFAGAPTVEHEEFNGEVSNSLEDGKAAAIIFAGLVCLILLIFQLYMVDGVISYHRGRGFLTGYGHHVHVYGRVNPRYQKEQEKHASKGGGHRSGGGCACACACACAGGGRAGCSQKDTKAFPVKKK